MLRMVLGFLIVGTSIFIGYVLSSRLKKRSEILSSYILLLEGASARISCNGESLSDAFSDNFAGCRFDSSIPFATQWEQMADRYQSILSHDDRRLLTDFAEESGHSDVTSVLRHLALYRDLLQSRREEADRDYEKKGALYRILPFSVGLVITILLL